MKMQGYDIVGYSINNIIYRISGGQSIPNWDYGMADGVNLSFISSIAERVAEKIASIYNMMDKIDEIKSTVKNLINTDETFKNLRYYRTTEKIDDAAVDSIDFLIRKSQFTAPNKTYSNYSVCDKSFCKNLFTLSIHDVEEETKQAMEAVIHNLNSMHCLPGSEEIWVKDATDNKVKLITMKNLHNTFSVGRYKAFSINMKTGITELKGITASANQGNNRDLVTLISDSGQRIRVTTNHKVITINEENGTLIKKYPEDTECLVSPKKSSINDYETHPELEQLRHMFTVPVHNKEYSNSLFEDVYDISVADNENFMTRDCVFVSNSRAGQHVAV